MPALPPPTSLPTTYNPVRCGSGFAENPPSLPSAYVSDNTVRWITPSLNPANGNHTSGTSGYYYFRTTFDLGNLCGQPSGIINFVNISADNKVDQVIVNQSTPFPVNYGFASLSSALIDISTALISGTNEILLRVQNPEFYTGLQVNGYLTVNTYNPSFCLSTSATSVNATASAMGNHTWEVYSSTTGNLATFNYVGTYTTPNLNLEGHGPCYYIKHKITGSCGSTCEARYVCHKECNELELCNLPSPTNVKYNQTTNTFSWDPVPGASNYVLEILPYDPECCPSVHPFGQITQNVSPPNTSYIWNRPTNVTCFSWRLKVLCANGTFVSTEKKCQVIGSGSGNPNDPPPGGND